MAEVTAAQDARKDADEAAHRRYASLEEQYDTLLDERDRLLSEQAERGEWVRQAEDQKQTLQETQLALDSKTEEVAALQRELQTAAAAAAANYTVLEQQYDQLLANRDALLADQNASAETLGSPGDGGATA